jgi:hypothetical protein
MNKKMRGAVLLPLIGLNLGWFVFMSAAFVGLFESDGYYSGPMGDVYNPGTEVRASTYIFLAGITLFTVLAAIAHRRADYEYHANGSTDAGARAAFRFATLTVIIGLVSGAIFAISAFLGSFNYWGGQPSPLGRFLGVYLPILLATILVVLVLLRVTVFRRSLSATVPMPLSQADAAIGKAEVQANPAVRKALALGLSLPIISTALAMILGLMFWDLQRGNLTSWTWVVIQSVIAFGIIGGTVFSVRAIRAIGGHVLSAAIAGASGSLRLNYVLTIIFGAIVTLMSFTMGFSAISELKWRNTGQATAQSILNNVDARWVFNDFLPTYVLLLLVTVAVFFTIAARHGKLGAGKPAEAVAAESTHTS